MDPVGDAERSIRLIREEMRFEVAALEGRVNALISAEAFLTIAFTMALGNTGTGRDASLALVAPILSVIGFVLAVLSWPGVGTSVRIINEWNILLIAALRAAADATRRMWRSAMLDEEARRSRLAHRRGMMFAQAVSIVFSTAWLVLAVVAIRQL